MYFYNVYRVSRFNLWFYDCAPRRVLYILGKWAIIEAELQPLAARMLGKELITAARIERRVQFVDSQREMKTFKKKTENGGMQFARGGCRNYLLLTAKLDDCRAAASASLLFEWWDACAVMERSQYMHA
jgi:hypothetical protein